MPQWEYDKINLNDAPRKSDDIDLLNDAGKGGWELMLISRNNVAYVKRQIDVTPVRDQPPPAQSRPRKAPSSHT